MKVYFCSDCGAEYEVDEAEGRQRRRLCGACKRIEAMERDLMKEWEVASGYVE